MTEAEEIAELKEQLRQALERLREVEGKNQVLQEQLAAAHKRIEELEKQKRAPEFVKANVAKPQAGEKQARKKREARHKHARRREQPTQVVEHRIK